MVASFHELIGMIIHHCGAIELLTNNAINALAKDPLLSTKIIKWPFARRIEVLRELLDDRTQLAKPDVKSLCDELLAIARLRNAVAHNPVADGLANLSAPFVMVVRHAPQGAKVTEKIARTELEALVNRTNRALVRFAELVPSSLKA